VSIPLCDHWNINSDELPIYGTVNTGHSDIKAVTGCCSVVYPILKSSETLLVTVY